MIARTVHRAVHVVAMAALFFLGSCIVGGAMTPAGATVYGIPFAVLATVTMLKSGWYFCD